jgi:EmrB/QacA subfamily drug resistance transporter
MNNNVDARSSGKSGKLNWVLILTSFGSFMAMLDAMVIATASTAIRGDLGISIGDLQWCTNAYNITIAALLLIGAAAGDRFGHKKLYILGLAVFVLGSIFSALSGNVQMLIGSRIIQGIGGSVITPLAMAILTSSVSPAERGKALGIFSGISGLALIAGPLLGGVIAAKLTWQWIFWINVPFGILAILLSLRKLPSTYGKASKFSLVDAILIMISSVGVIWALTDSAQKDVQSSTWIIGAISIVLGLVFVFRQKRTENAMIPLTFFKTRSFSAAIAASFLLYASMFAAVFFLPQYLQVATGADALTAGLELLPWTVMLFFVAPIAGKAVDKVGERSIAIAGLVLQGLGYAWIALTIQLGSPYWTMIIPFILSGAGISMAGPALQKAVLGSVDMRDLGKAAGIFNMFRLLGGASGVTICVVIFYHYGTISTTTSFANGCIAATIGASVISLLGALLSVPLRPAILVRPDSKVVTPNSTEQL